MSEGRRLPQELVMLCRICCLVLFGTVFHLSTAYAGDTCDGDSTHVKGVEKMAANSKHHAYDDLNCLRSFLGCDMGHSPNWGNPRGAKCLKRARRNRFRKRLSRACQKLVESDPGERELCVLILARVGVATIGDTDIHQFITETHPKLAEPWLLAVLNNPRSVEFLIHDYDHLRERKEIHYADHVIASHRRQVLNALYHFRAPESRPLLKKVAAGDDKSLSRQARRILRRIRPPTRAAQ